MAYIGKTPTPAPLTASDITDGIISNAKLGSDSVNAAKISDDSISDEHLDITSITGQTAITSLADTDKFLVSDASDSGNLKYVENQYLGGGGSWVLLDTQTVSSGTPASVGTGAVFSSTYDTYVVVIRRFKLNSTVGLQFRLGNSSGYTTSGYRWNGSGVGDGGNSLVTGSSDSTIIDLLGGSSSTYHCNTTQDCLSGVIWVHNPYNSSRTSIHAEMAWENATDVKVHINNVAAHPNTNTSYDRWVMYPSSDYFAATTIIQTFGVINA
jgi:hypothetical protein|tara:strand:- start:709 stop:1512 length:804 start_codon:yes stop_codon:yes gene_type:complete